MKTTRRHVLKMAAAGVLAGPFHRMTPAGVFAGDAVLDVGMPSAEFCRVLI